MQMIPLMKGTTTSYRFVHILKLDANDPINEGNYNHSNVKRFNILDANDPINEGNYN